MFGLSKKTNEPGELDGILKMLNPLLKMKGINLETMISEAANAAKNTFDATGVQIFLMVALDDSAQGFDLGFYTQDTQGLQLLHSVNIKSVADAISQFSALSSTFKALSTNATQNNTTSELASPAIDAQPDNAEQPDPLDSSDAE